MAAKSGGESRGLIITLVFFILASIVLGVVAYYGYADQAKLTQDRKDADTKFKEMEKQRNYYRFLAMQLKEYIGELPMDERQQFTTDRQQWPDLGKGMKDEQTYVGLLKKLDDSRGFAQGRSQRPFATDLAKKTADLKKSEEERQLALNAKEDAERAKAEAEKKLRDATTNFETALKNAADKAGTELRTFSEDTLKQRQEQIDQLSKDVADLKNEKAARDTDVRRLQDQIRKQEDLQKKMAAARTARVDAAQNDRPKGEIYSVEGDGSTLILRLPSTARLPQQQTFSVRGVGPGGQVQANVKGTVTVTAVLNDRLARARVTDVRDRGGDPILRGDKIFSLGWNPNVQQHVAIAGLVDVDSSQAGKNPAEAQRRLLDFKRNLESQGMIVDAYINLLNPKIEGEITLETDYLILGEVPQGIPEPRLVKDKDKEKEKEEQAADTVSSLVSRMMQDAARQGVTIIPFRKFVLMTGYRTLRTGGNEPAAFEAKPKLPAAGSPVEKKAPSKTDAERTPEGEAQKPEKTDK